MENRFSKPYEASSHRSREVVSQHPMPSVMLAFGLGFGVGAVLGASLVDAMREERGFAERFGQQMLDAMARVLPESVTSSLRG